MPRTRLLLLLLLLVSFVGCTVDFAAQLALIAVDQTVIVTQSGCPYISFAANWIHFVEKLNLHNYLIFAEDQITLDYVNNRHENHAVLVSGLYEEAATTLVDFAEYGDETFRQLTKSRPSFLISVLQAGYTALWVDSDVVLLQNPLQTLPTLYEYVGVDDAAENRVESTSSNICTCLLYLKPTVKVKSLLADWLAACQDARYTNQQAFNAIFNSRHSSELQFYIMPRRAFPNGALSRSDNFSWSNHAQPYWSHANWVRGLNNKRKHFVNQGLWRLPDDIPTNCTPQGADVLQ